jgi:hypothetical protein
MKYRKSIAALMLSFGLLTLVSQSSADAADKDDPKTAKNASKKDKAALKAKREALKKKLESFNKKSVTPPVIAGEPVNPNPPKSPSNPSPTASVVKLIDQGIDVPLAAAKIQKSAQASDAEFLRRASLDITGVIPSSEKTVAFLDDKSPGKRAKLIDDLLETSGFGKRQSDIWTTLLFPVDSENRFVGREPLRDWLAYKFNKNVHWDQIAFELITADGDMEANAATVYPIANRGIDKMTDSVGKLFMGMQIQCAQCHNHPFAKWKQEEYWGMAQFFYKVNVSNPRALLDGGTVTVSETSRVNRRQNPLPEAAKSVSPQFLGDKKVSLNPSADYRPVLGHWVCSSENPYFAKAFVNRVWSQFMGRGLVNPIDDLSDENPPSHPELFNALTKEFVKSGFDIKHLVRCICNSEAYQRTSKPLGDNRDDKTLYSHQTIKVLAPEQLFDSLMSVVGTPQAGRPDRKGQVAAFSRAPFNVRDQFVNFFTAGEEPKTVDYEAGIPQALRLMNSPLMAQVRLTNVAVFAGELLQNRSKPEKVIENLYLKTLSRRPTEEETARVKKYVAQATDPRSGYADIVWVLLNSSEFALNR